MARSRRAGSSAARSRLAPGALTAGPLPERVACLWLSHFAVHAERSRCPELAFRPVVLVESGDGQNGSVIAACSPEASAGGLSVGAPAHTVPQRCPAATMLPFDRAYYQQRYHQLLLALDVITPAIEIQPLELFYLDLSGLPQLDGSSPEALGEQVRELIPRPFTVRLGIANGKFTARVAAHRARSGHPLAIEAEEKAAFLRDAPTSLLPVSKEISRQLQLMGLRTLGQIAQLPRSALLSRFGWAGEALHCLASGEDREPLTPHQPKPVIQESWIFDTAPTSAHFNLALEHLVRRAWARPERGEQGVRQVRILARLESGDAWERRLTLRQPTERPEHACAELKRRLETCLPAAPIARLTVELAALAPRVDAQRLLFENERLKRQEQLEHALSQLRERLRLPAVLRIVEVDQWSLLPEERHGLVRYDP